MRSQILKIVIIGDTGVGKSCLMNRFLTNCFEQVASTVGVQFCNKDVLVNGICYTLQIWDTAGLERFDSLRTSYYRGTDVCILAYAINNRQSFMNLAKWKNEFCLNADQNPTGFPFIVVGCKADTANRHREVQIEEVNAWCAVNGQIPCIETSAKDIVNVDKTFAMAADEWKRLERGIPEILSPFPQPVLTSKRGCC